MGHLQLNLRQNLDFKIIRKVKFRINLPHTNKGNKYTNNKELKKRKMRINIGNYFIFKFLIK